MSDALWKEVSDLKVGLAEVTKAHNVYVQQTDQAIAELKADLNRRRTIEETAERNKATDALNARIAELEGKLAKLPAGEDGAAADGEAPQTMAPVG